MTLEEALKEIERRDEIINSYKILLNAERQEHNQLKKDYKKLLEDYYE